MFRTRLRFALLFSLSLPILGALCYRDVGASPRTPGLLALRQAPAPEPDKGSPGPVGSTKARTFNSTLPLLVMGLVEGEMPRTLGVTGFPGGKPVNIPANIVWYVQPAVSGGFGMIGMPAGGFVGGVGNVGALQVGSQLGGVGPIGKRPAKGPRKPAIEFGPELTGKPLAALIAEMRKSNIPGLALGPRTIGDDDLALIGSVSGLQTLILDHSRVGDSAIAKLKDFRSLRLLSLENSPVTDEGLKAIKDIKTLGRLHLGGKTIANKGLANLREAENLTWLRLNDVGADGDGLANLASLTRLETLEVCGGYLDSELKVLAKLPRLQKLRLHRTGITDETLTLLAGCKELRSVSIDSHWGLEGMLPNILFEDGKINWNLGNTGLAAAAAVKATPPRFTAKGIAKLAALPNFEELNVGHDKWTDDDLAFLPKFAPLKRLGIFAPGVTDKGLAELKSLTKLEAIDLRGTQATTATALVLRSAPALKLVKSNLVSIDPKYKEKLAGWKKQLPRTTVRPLLDLGVGLGVFGMPGAGAPGGGAGKKP